MAKMFYSLEEAADKLGKSTDEVRAMAQSGQITEFRDGDRLIFKVDQIDLLAVDDFDADPDMSSMIPLADTGGPSTGLESLGASGSAAGSGSGLGAITLEDGGSEGSGFAAGGSGDRSGVNVFDADEIGDVDASADTILAGGGPALDAASLESFGSGSGLMDLTRESDETSLGAEGLLDELYSADDAVATGGRADDGGDLFAGAASAAEEQLGPAIAGVLPEIYDGRGSMLAGGMMLVACLALLAGVGITIMGLIGAPTDFLASLPGGGMMIPTAAALGATLLLGGLGWMLGGKSS
ncbi:MAG: helix-turn-helix domain-containing protein [Phycisphaerales bacterium]|nr:helix-turn-helix domain-containing protein [Phycisphaerales bacterium]